MYALTAQGMRYMDQYSMTAGVLSPVLMENAARGLAEETAARFPDRNSRILIICGSGNNGGDAVATGRWLKHLGYRNVQLWFNGDITRASKECSRQLAIIYKAYPDIRIPGANCNYDMNVIRADYDVIIDGVFGIGLNRDLSDNDRSMIEYLNSRNSFRIAADIPSGINGTTGQLMGAAFKADLTVTFGNPKTGLYFGDGRKYSGEISVIDIGIVESGYDNIKIKPEICDNAFYENNAHKNLKPRDDSGHKGTYGAVGIVVGTGGMLGASILAAKSAYRSGCGLVKVLCPEECVGVINAAVPEAVAIAYTPNNFSVAMQRFRERLGVVLIGPGLQEDGVGAGLLKCVMSDSIPAVVDAGALNIISENRDIIINRNCECVITPHMGELARLCNTTIKAVSADRLGYVKYLSEKFNISMVAKSDVSVIALRQDFGRKYYLNTTGNSGLATAGSGDVLAGVIASLIAQGNTLNDSLLYGVMIHGRSAEKFAVDDDQKRRMMAGDIVDNLF